MRVGLIAPEFPPERGGMQIMAQELAHHLAQLCDLTLFVTPKSKTCSASGHMIAALSGRAETDLPILRKHRVDLWFAMNAGYAAIAAELDAPMVAYFHGNDFLVPWALRYSPVLRARTRMPYLKTRAIEMKKSLGRQRIQAGMRSLAHIITNSSNTERLIRSTFDNLPPISICPPGVSAKFFQAHAKRESGPIRFLTVSRLTKRTRRKNVSGVLVALSSIKGKVDFEYRVVGTGDDMSRLVQQAKDLGLETRVKFLGNLAEVELVEQYRSADLFVLPVQASALDVEGFGMVYIEANASGTPVLCSSNGGATDAVIHGKTGILIDSSEPEAIAAGILDFVARIETFDEETIRAFAEGFRWPAITRRIMSILESTVDSGLQKQSAASLAARYA